MKKLSNEEIKKIEFDLLLELDKYCKASHLCYYLAGGTLLGAVRYQGFIPWDDDIDILMPRPDYETLVKQFTTEKNNIALRSNRLNNLDGPFAKLVDLNTSVNFEYADDNIDKNIWIDIFPVDGLPQDENLVRKIFRECAVNRRILRLISCRLGKGKTAFRKYMKYFLKPLACLYGKKRCLENMEKYIEIYKYEDAVYVGAVTGGLYGTRERMLKAEFAKPTELCFEGKKFPAFSCWHEYLTNLYGKDYMDEPEPEKRFFHPIEAYRC